MRSHHNFLLNHYTIIFAFILAIAASCVEDINLDSEKEMPVVVECVLTRDTVQTLRLYRMRVLSETGNEPIGDATAILKGRNKNGDFETVAEFHRTDGIRWEARFQPEYGTEYTLTISIPGKEDITASTRFPEDLRLVKCSRAAFRRDDRGSDGGVVSPACIMYTAEVRQGKYYHEWNQYKTNDGSAFKAYLNVSDSPCKIWVFQHTDTTMVYADGKPLNILNEGFFLYTGSTQPFSKHIATSHPGADRFNISPQSLHDLGFWNRPIKKGRTDYSGWCLLLCPETPVFDGFVRIDHPADFRNGLSDKDLKVNYHYSDRCFYIEGDYSDKFASSNSGSFLNEVHFLSDEYDTYLRALYVRTLSNNDFILSSYDYSNIPSNINGGVGIFGADNTTWDIEQTVDRLGQTERLIWEELCPNANN